MVAGVARTDPSATRTTKDVDLLVCRADLERVTTTLAELGFQRPDLRSLVLFIDPEEPSRRSGVRLVWADERVLPSYPVPAPSVAEVELDPEGFRVLSLPSLVRMKLTSYRDIDRVHIGDLLSVRLIDDQVRATLPAELLERLLVIEEQMEQ